MRRKKGNGIKIAAFLLVSIFTMGVMGKEVKGSSLSLIPSNGHIVAIDPGHQSKGMYEQEPIGPGSSVKKAKVASGTRGIATGKPEYELTLEVAKKLRDELIQRGYGVVMIRETHEVALSNKDRAEIANASNAEIFIRLHGNGSEDTSQSGVLTLGPTKLSPYIPALYEESSRLCTNLGTQLSLATGAKNRGIWETDTMSGINWSLKPVSIVEMGFMTNPLEDSLMASEEYQKKMATGLANGVDAYFAMTP
ncbi:N-acetylmuramoyl-L-alanine amidase [bacterium 1XD42-8]|nr:N-acetylmuramoyl-L-alanine amidase [bacterium 1XD42-8]